MFYCVRYGGAAEEMAALSSNQNKPQRTFTTQDGFVVYRLQGSERAPF